MGDTDLRNLQKEANSSGLGDLTDVAISAESASRQSKFCRRVSKNRHPSVHWAKIVTRASIGQKLSPGRPLGRCPGQFNFPPGAKDVSVQRLLSKWILCSPFSADFHKVQN